MEGAGKNRTLPVSIDNALLRIRMHFFLLPWRNVLHFISIAMSKPLDGPPKALILALSLPEVHIYMQRT